MPLIISNNKIFSNGGVGISVPPEIDALIDGNLITGAATAIEVRDLHTLVNKTFSQIEASNLTEPEKQKVTLNLKKLILSIPKPSRQLFKDAALAVDLLAHSPEAYKTATDLIHFIASHFK